MLVPVETEMASSRNALKKLRKTAYVGDVVSPVNEKWESMESGIKKLTDPSILL